MVRAVAKQVVRQNVEDKYNSHNLVPSGTPVTVSGFIDGSVLHSILPPVTQGDDTWERIGDRLRPKRLRVEITVTTNGQLPDAFLATVRCLILEDRSNKNATDLPTVTAPRLQLLLDNGANQFQFTGRNQDLNTRINNRLFKVHCDKKLQLSKTVGTRLSSGAPGNMGSSMNTPQAYRFSVVIPTPAQFIYAFPGSGTPTNFAPFIVLGYAFNDSNYAADPAEVPNQRISWNYMAHLDYEDA